MALELRWYQRSAIDALYDYWATSKGDNPLLTVPTGGGKSLIIASLCQEALTAYPGTRILVVTHNKELIQQNHDELKGLWPEADAGIYSAGVGRRDTKHSILFAGVQSFYKKIYKVEPFDLILIDEAHTIPTKDTTRYGELIKAAKLMNPHVKLIGLTATPFRLDSGWLHKGPSALFDGIAYDISVQTLIDEGYLVPVVSKGGAKTIDLSNVHKRGGEYIESELAAAASDPELVSSVVSEIVAYGRERRAWLVFASGVGHAQLLKDEFAHYDVHCEILTGETAKSERDRITAAFKAGSIKCLINIGVLTTGFNAPICDLVALVRATMSTALYVQIVGRGMRLYPGKENCMFLDYGNNVVTHGPVDKPTPVIRSSGGGGKAPGKECPSCHALLHAASGFCPDCGHEFPPPELSHGSRAYEGAILSSQVSAQVVDVTKVTYARHTKFGSPDSLKVTYWAGIQSYSEWICLDHDGFAKDKADRFVQLVGGSSTNVNEALFECEAWKIPATITVKPDGKFHKIISKEY